MPILDLSAPVCDRYILHVDMDAFYASVEQLDNPSLRGKAIAIGGKTRGVISTASYEARRYGVHSAMPVHTALRLCPSLILLPGRMERYAEISCIIMRVLHDFSPKVEQSSVDEAYIDATGLERLFGSVEMLARSVKVEVQKNTGGLTCSVGVAPVKFLAKIASDRQKPNGLTIIRAEEIPAFMRTLSISDIPSVGKIFFSELEKLGIHRCGDVQTFPRDFFERRFGKAGIVLWERSQGIDRREVVPYTPPKSESAESTFDEDTTDYKVMKAWLYRHSDRVGRALRKRGLTGRVVTVKIKYADFSQVTKQVSLPEPTCATRTVYEEACRLLHALAPSKPVRLIGVAVSGFYDYTRQYFLPSASLAHEEEKRRTRLDRVMDKLNGKLMTGQLFELKHTADLTAVSPNKESRSCADRTVKIRSE